MEEYKADEPITEAYEEDDVTQMSEMGHKMQPDELDKLCEQLSGYGNGDGSKGSKSNIQS